MLKYGNNLVDLPPCCQRDGEPIKKVDEIKDLRVLMTRSATFESEIQNAVQQSSRQASRALRIFWSWHQTSMMTLFRSLIGPHLEYC